MEKTYSEKLAKCVLILIIIAIISAFCWLIRDVLTYLILAALVALLSRPLNMFIRKIHIRKHYFPDWGASILSIIAVFAILSGVIVTMVPLIHGIIQDISKASIDNMAQNIARPLANFNVWIRSTFPGLGPDFKIESTVLDRMKEILNVGMVSDVVGSVTGFIAKLGVGVFSVIFISFFFIKEPALFSSIVAALVPDRHEEKVRKSLEKIEVLVSRYFIGITIEMFGVGVLNFLSLLLIGNMGFKYSLGIGFMTGILNIIPYIGPLLGGVLGVTLCLTIKYACFTAYGLSVGVLPFILILVAIFVVTQLIDNYIFQPVIYSSSVNVHPLEIFIVFLIAGKIGGMAGMFAAIPAYTVLRETASVFLGNVKPIRLLTDDRSTKHSSNRP